LGPLALQTGEPTSATIQAARQPRDVLIEIAVIAYKR
jgi:enamine deaminase RidA (YjgF/YER057c/UK114 family)